MIDNTSKNHHLKNVNEQRPEQKFSENYKENVTIIVSWVFVENKLSKRSQFDI